jgi:ribose transport system permease protein
MTSATLTVRRASPRQLLGRAAAANSYALVPLALAVGLFIANAIVQPAFLNQSNWASTMAVLCPFVLTSCAQAIPVLSGNGGLDLSVGPFAGFVTVMVAGELVPAGLSAPAVLIPLVCLLGLAAGAVNGVLIGYLRLPPIIATLGTYLFYTGMATEVLSAPGGTVPSWLVQLNGSYGPIPGVWFVLLAVAVVWALFTRTAYIRNLLALGGDERAAYTSAVNVAAVRVWAYALGGLLAALAGLMLCGLINSGDPTVGGSYTVSSITAVALGGIALAGGRGGLLGAALGGVVLFLIQNLLTAAHVSVYELSIVNGAVLIAALAFNGITTRLRRRREGVAAPAVTESPIPATAGEGT